MAAVVKEDKPAEPDAQRSKFEDAANLLLTSFRCHAKMSHPEVLEQESEILSRWPGGLCKKMYLHIFREGHISL